MDEIRTLLRRNLPGYKVWSVTELGEGLDNAAHEVNGELIVRTSKESDPALWAEFTRREVDLLTAVAGISTLPVPEPIFADPEAGAIAYPRRGALRGRRPVPPRPDFRVKGHEPIGARKTIARPRRNEAEGVSPREARLL